MISELIRRRPEPRVVKWVASTDEAVFFVSVPTLGGIRKGTAALRSASRRAALEAWLGTELRPGFSVPILPIDVPVADRWGVIAGTGVTVFSPWES